MFGNKKKTTLGFAIRSMASGRLRKNVRNEREPTKKQKIILDLTENPARPPPILGGGPVCTCGPPQVGCITFRTA
jgi:hypothetical protein